MKVVDVIVSDDARQELRGKWTLTGIFGDRIIIPPEAAWPVGLRLAISVRFILEQGDQVPDAFTFTIWNEGQEVAGFRGTLAIRDPSHIAALYLTAEQVPLLRPGSLTFRFVLT